MRRKIVSFTCLSIGQINSGQRLPQKMQITFSYKGNSGSTQDPLLYWWIFKTFSPVGSYNYPEVVRLVEVVI
jgi:hypothetical protein